MLLFGIDQLLNSGPNWKYKSIGLITNQAATTRSGIPTRKALQDAGLPITMLFSPEHGLDVKGADGAPMHDGIDTLTGLPVVSLYGQRLAPEAAQLDTLDLLLFDIPDIGCRYYTYLWTLTHVMEALVGRNLKLMILDRPNPVSGAMKLVEGNLLDAGTESFIGRWPIPVRHSCTIGELARYFNRTQGLNIDLEVIACAGWERDMMQPAWGLPFTPTSPAIQSFEAMLLYPAICLLEATNISEGRGSELSFMAAGAPWLNNEMISVVMNDMLGEDIEAIPTQFTPVSGKYAQQECKAVQLKVKEVQYFKPMLAGLILIKLIRSLHPQEFEWSPYPTHVNPDGAHHLDKLLGMKGCEALFDKDFATFLPQATKLLHAGNWKAEIAPFLLY